MLYVDDMLIGTKSLVEVNKFRSQLSTEFDMKYLGEVKKIEHGDQMRHDGKEIVFVTRKEFGEGFATTINLTLVEK